MLPRRAITPPTVNTARATPHSGASTCLFVTLLLSLRTGDSLRGKRSSLNAELVGYAKEPHRTRKHPGNLKGKVSANHFIQSSQLLTGMMGYPPTPPVYTRYPAVLPTFGASLPCHLMARLALKRESRSSMPDLDCSKVHRSPVLG